MRGTRRSLFQSPSKDKPQAVLHLNKCSTLLSMLRWMMVPLPLRIKMLSSHLLRAKMLMSCPSRTKILRSHPPWTKMLRSCPPRTKILSSRPSRTKMLGRDLQEQKECSSCQVREDGQEAEAVARLLCLPTSFVHKVLL